MMDKSILVAAISIFSGCTTLATDPDQKNFQERIKVFTKCSAQRRCENLLEAVCHSFC